MWTSEQEDKILAQWKVVLELLKTKLDAQIISKQDKEELNEAATLEELNAINKELNDKLAVRLDDKLKEAMLDLLDSYYALKINIVNLNDDFMDGETPISMQKFFASNSLYEGFIARHPELKGKDEDLEYVIKPLNVLAQSNTEWSSRGVDFWIYSKLDRNVDLYIATDYDDSYMYLNYHYVTKESLFELLQWQNRFNDDGDIDLANKLIKLYEEIFEEDKNKITK